MNRAPEPTEQDIARAACATAKQGSEVSDSVINALHAVNKLNSWVRSQSFHKQWGGSLRRVIYHLKRQAILRAHAELACEHGPFLVRMQCRDCGGSGRYSDCNGYLHDHCWACNSSGTVTLHFIETLIGSLMEGSLGPRYSHLFTWHSPADKFPSGLPLESRGIAGHNWIPNLPGIDMTPDEAAECLNAAHEIFHDPIPNHHSYDRYDSYVTNDSRYPLWIGETEPICSHCGIEVNPTEGTRCGRTAGRVKWSFHVCAACRASLGSPRYFEVSCPTDLWRKQKNVDAWIVRQNAFAENHKVERWE